MRVSKLFVTLITVALVFNALATYVELGAANDADVRQGAPDYGKGDRTWHYVCNTPGNSGKLYIKFELPADFYEATSINLKLFTGAVHSGSYAGVMNVHGVKDNVANQDWTGHELTWNNAMANDTSSGFEFTSDATGVLGTFTMAGGRSGGAVGDEYNVSTQALLDFINTDTDGIVNICIGRVGVSSAWHGIAANELGTYPGPVLEMNYIPEPASIGLFSLGLLVLRRRK